MANTKAMTILSRLVPKKAAVRSEYAMAYGAIFTDIAATRTQRNRISQRLFRANVATIIQMMMGMTKAT